MLWLSPVSHGGLTDPCLKIGRFLVYGQPGQLFEIAHPVHKPYDDDFSRTLSLHCRNRTLNFQPNP